MQTLNDLQYQSGTGEFSATEMSVTDIGSCGSTLSERQHSSHGASACQQQLSHWRNRPARLCNILEFYQQQRTYNKTTD